MPPFGPEHRCAMNRKKGCGRAIDPPWRSSDNSRFCSSAATDDDKPSRAVLHDVRCSPSVSRMSSDVHSVSLSDSVSVSSAFSAAYWRIICRLPQASLCPKRDGAPSTSAPDTASRAAAPRRRSAEAPAMRHTSATVGARGLIDAARNPLAALEDTVSSPESAGRSGYPRARNGISSASAAL